MWVWFCLFSVQQCTRGLESSLISILGWTIGICQLQKLIVITHCRQLRQLLQAVASFDRCSQLWQLLHAVASLDSFFKLLAARPQLHFYINIASMFDSISKNHSDSKRSLVSQSVIDWHSWNMIGPGSDENTRNYHTIKKSPLRSISVY